MWVWTTQTILDDPAEHARFVSDTKATGLTDVYLYLTAPDYERPDLERLLSALNASGIQAWAMDGYRGYFDDADGPSALYRGVDALLAFNAANPVKFAGFHSDLEPQDGQGVGQSLFHNGLADSELSAVQHADRARLLTNWLILHQTLRDKLHAAGLRYGAAIPSWTDDYFGEPVHASFRERVQPVTHHLLGLTDDYVIMAYNTNPANVIALAAGEIAAASAMARPPRILVAVETHAGVGRSVSYGDTPPKNVKSSVITDLDTVHAYFAKAKAFGGTAVHDWVGWRDLSSAGTTAANAGGPAHASGWFSK
jgi:hypothetical protein